MNTRHIAFTLVPVAILAGSLFSYDDGTLPGSTGGIVSDAARQGPSCTSCHGGTIGSSGVATRLSVPHHSLDLNESVQVSLQVTGGPSGNDGGFAAENTGGAFSASSTTRINSTGRNGQFSTHRNADHRSWSFPYTAPNAPGLMMLFAVGMAANGSGTRGDSIAFTGFDSAATVGTPVYVGVNAAGNQRLGQGCVGSFGNWAVLYSEESPTVGNSSYALKLAGAAPNANALFLLGLPRATPLSLGAIGATGCGLWVDVLASAAVVTSNGHAQRGEGTGSTALPIPSDNGLRGATLGTQVAVVDPANGRTLPITLTNGLAITFR